VHGFQEHAAYPWPCISSSAALLLLPQLPLLLLLC
jgi:hypothetical protein